MPDGQLMNNHFDSKTDCSGGRIGTYRGIIRKSLAKVDLRWSSTDPTRGTLKNETAQVLADLWLRFRRKTHVPRIAFRFEKLNLFSMLNCPDVLSAPNQATFFFLFYVRKHKTVE
jgi:hypothetical protein